MDRRLLGAVVAAAGLVLVVISVFADSIGIGNETGFGAKQTVGTVVGAVALAGGLGLTYVSRRREVPARAEE